MMKRVRHDPNLPLKLLERELKSKNRAQHAKARFRQAQCDYSRGTKTEDVLPRGEDGLLPLAFIVANATAPPVITGIYFLLRGSEVVYVGQSTNVHARIFSHVAACDKGDFDKVFVLVCSPAELSPLERGYIRKLRPRFNAIKYNNLGRVGEDRSILPPISAPILSRSLCPRAPDILDDTPFSPILPDPPHDWRRRK